MKTRGYLAVLAAVVLWGCTYLLLGELLTRFPPSELIAVRFTGSLLLTVVVFRRSVDQYRPEAAQAQSGSGRNPRFSSLPPTLIAVLGGFSLAGAAFTQKYGIKMTDDAVQSAFVSALVVVCIPFLQKALGDAVSLKRVMLPVGLAAFGTAMLVNLKLPTNGIVLLMICAIFYGLQSVFVGEIKKHVHYATAHAIACVCCIITAAPFLLGVDRRNLRLPSTTAEWIGLATLTLLSTFVPWNLVHYSQQFKNLSAYRVGLLYTLEPVFTALIGISLLHFGVPVKVQTLTTIPIIGCILIVAANQWMARIDAN